MRSPSPPPSPPRPLRRGRVGAAAAIALLALLIGVAAPGGDTARAQSATALPPLLDALADQAERLQAAGVGIDADAVAGKPLRDAIALRALRLDDRGLVQVEVRLRGAGPSPAALLALGVEAQIWRPDLGHAQLAVPPERLRDLRALTGVRAVALPSYAVAARGATLTEGHLALRFAALRERTGLRGAGVRIGVISDGIGGLADAQASGDLPDLAEQRAFAAGGIDAGAEGTALLEIVHDIAPEAALYFAAVSTHAEMIEAVDYLAQRTDVVVDDLGFPLPDDQRSAVSLNTAAALDHPDWPIRAYITAVGSWALRHYEGDFRAGPDGSEVGLAGAGPVHTFGDDGSTDQRGRGEAPYNELRLERGDELRALLLWDDPWEASVNDYDLFLLDPAGTVVAAATAEQGVAAGYPREQITFKNDGEGGLFRLVVQNAGGRAAPRRLELFAFGPPEPEAGGTVLNFNTTASSLLAQSDAPGGVIAAGAVGHAGADLRTVRPYSSRGPTNNGAQKPDLVAADGVAVTGSGGFPSPFLGSSAAAPHVAALAALLLEARPQLLAEDGGAPDRERALLRHVLTGSAVDIDAPGLDYASGHGRADAIAAADLLDTVALLVDRDDDTGPGSLRAVLAAAARDPDGPRAVFLAPGLTISLARPLPAVTRADLTISGAATILGDGLPGGAPGLVLSGAGQAVEGLTISAVPGVAIHIAGATDAAIDGVTLTGNGAGIRVDGGATGVGIGRGRGVTIVHNAGDGVVVSGEGTRDVTIQNSRIGVAESDTPAGNARDGVRVEAGATDVVLGAPAPAGPGLQTAQVGRLVHTIRGRVTLNGAPAPRGVIVEALLDGRSVAATTVGLIDVEGEPGFILTIPGPGLSLRFRVAGEVAMALVLFEPGRLSDIVVNVTSAVPHPESALPGANVVAYNEGAGLRHDAGRVTNRGNVIHGNAGGDVRGAADVARSDAPVLTAFRYDGDRLRVEGSAAPDATVDLYVAEDAAAPAVAPDASGAGGALRYLGSATATGGRFTAPDLAPGVALALTALATEPGGATSLFAVNLRLGPGPRVDAVFPTEGTSAGGFQVTITGAGLGGPDRFRVFFGDREAVALAVSDSRAVVIAPPQGAGPVPLRVEAADGRALVLEDAFTYLAGRVLQLAPGWNNVTWSGPRTPTATALAPLAPRVDRVFSWIAAEQRWRRFIAGAPAIVNDLDALETGQTLWLLLDGDAPLTWSQPPP